MVVDSLPRNVWTGWLCSDSDSSSSESEAEAPTTKAAAAVQTEGPPTPPTEGPGGDVKGGGKDMMEVDPPKSHAEPAAKRQRD